MIRSLYRMHGGRFPERAYLVIVLSAVPRKSKPKITLGVCVIPQSPTVHAFSCCLAICLSRYVSWNVQRAWEAGEQVFISYGPRSNDLLLQRYGFVEADNRHDVYCITGLVDKVRTMETHVALRFRLINHRVLQRDGENCSSRSR